MDSGRGQEAPRRADQEVVEMGNISRCRDQTVLKSRREIARVFGVRQESVQEWYDAGAPIALINGRMKALAVDLMHWLVRRRNKSERPPHEEEAKS